MIQHAVRQGRWLTRAILPRQYTLACLTVFGALIGVHQHNAVAATAATNTWHVAIPPHAAPSQFAASWRPLSRRAGRHSNTELGFRSAGNGTSATKPAGLPVLLHIQYYLQRHLGLELSIKHYPDWGSFTLALELEQGLGLAFTDTVAANKIIDQGYRLHISEPILNQANTESRMVPHL